MQLEFVAHGVPQGHQSWGTTSDRYYETFYGKYDIYRKARTVFVVEVRDNPGTRSCYYTLMHPQNVLAAGGRTGSYFGMSLRVDGSYCTDVFSLFHLFEIAFNQYIASRVLTQVGESEQFKVDNLNTAEHSLQEAKKYILSQIQSHLNSEFEEIDDTFTKKNVQINEYYNPVDINSEAFFNSTRVDGKVLISSDYPTKDAIIRSYRTKDKQTQEAKKADDERIDSLSKENSSLRQYKDSATSLRAEVSKLKEENQKLTADLSSEKGTTASLKSQLSLLKSQVEQLKNAANIHKIARDLDKSMSEMIPILRAIAPEARRIDDSGQIHDHPKHHHHFFRDKCFFKYILIALAIVALFFLILIWGIKSGPKISELKKENTELVQKNRRLQEDYEKIWTDYNDLLAKSNSLTSNPPKSDWPNLKIDVKNFNGSDMAMGQSYSVQIKGFDGNGAWIGDGFTIEGSANNKTVKVKPSRVGEICLRYKVNNQIVKERKFWVK